MKSKMDNNFIKLAKFEKLIEGLSEKFKLLEWKCNYGYYMKLIYDYDELNYYGKIIFEKLRVDMIDEDFSYLVTIIDGTFDNKINVTKSLVDMCMYRQSTNAYKFIFWALMILSVDKKDKDEKLSLICDLASMMNVKEHEVLDIIKIIKLIYGEKYSKSDFVSTKIKDFFKEILEMYGII